MLDSAASWLRSKALGLYVFDKDSTMLQDNTFDSIMIA